MNHLALETRRAAQAQQFRIWSGCLPESPTCAVEGCDRHAVEVDAFFPYLDDRNRCDFHSDAPCPLTAPRMPRRTPLHAMPHCN